MPRSLYNYKEYLFLDASINSSSHFKYPLITFYLETKYLNETIMIPELSIDHVRMARRLKMLGMNALFTSISDLDAEEIMELYRKRNRVEHCFRTINSMEIAFPIYHRTPPEYKDSHIHVPSCLSFPFTDMQ